METGPGFLTRGAIEDFEVRTTYDKRIQSAVDSALTHVFDTKVRAGSGAQAAVVVMTRDGAVRALVGGRRVHAAGNFNRATQHCGRPDPFSSPSSTPLHSKRATPLTIESLTNLSRITSEVPVPGLRRTTGANISVKITLTDALAFSVNTVAVKLSEGIGRHRVAEIAREAWHRGTSCRGTRHGAGASESTLLAMTSAYASILNGGRRVDPYGVVNMRLKDRSSRS